MQFTITTPRYNQYQASFSPFCSFREKAAWERGYFGVCCVRLYSCCVHILRKAFLCAGNSIPSAAMLCLITLDLLGCRDSMPIELKLLGILGSGTLCKSILVWLVLVSGFPCFLWVSLFLRSFPTRKKYTTKYFV